MGASEKKTSMAARGGRIWHYLLIAGGTAIVLVIGVAAYSYLSFRASGPTVKIAAAPIQISIQNPGSETIWQAEDLIHVEGLAIGPNPFVEAELWINGELMGVDSAPDGGLNPWNTLFTWSPREPGFYSLVMRGSDDQERSGISDAIVVYVMPSPKLLNAEADGETLDMETDEPSVFPAALSIKPITAPNTEDPAGGPSQPWSGSPGTWITSLAVSKPPEKPELAIDIRDCKAILSIHDLSDDEEGFAVYRQSLTTPIWGRVATLSSQSDLEWLGHTDVVLPGSYTYYVSAFNSQGESNSNIAAVSDSFTDCGAQENRSQSRVIKISNLRSNLPVDRAYCYRSFNGINWERWPDFGFFLPGEDGFHLEQETRTFVLHDLGEVSGSQELEFHLECWGWVARNLDFLGSMDLEIMEGEGTFQLGDPNVSAEVLVYYGGDLALPTFDTKNTEALRGITYALTHSTVDFDEAGSAIVLPDEIIPSSVRFPYIQAWVSHIKENCFDHLEPESQVAFGTLFLCSPIGDYLEGPGGLNPQPYILWSFYTTCPAGSGDTCLPLSWWMNWAEEKGRKAYVEIEENLGSSTRQYIHSDELARTVLRVNPRNCVGDRKFRVRLVFDQGTDYISETSSIQRIASPWSNWVRQVSCRKPLGDEVLIEVTFDTIQWSHVDDDDLSGPQVIETYGGLWAGTPETPGVVPYGLEWGNRIQDPRWNVLSFATDANSPRIDFHDGIYNVEAFEICRQLVERKGLECDPAVFPDPVPSPWETNNNILLIPLKDGDDILFSVTIRDYDASSSDDTVCNVVRRTPTRTLKGWADAKSDVFQLHQPDNGNAECLVTIRLRAVSQ